jgi:thimet oligopeptidase
MPPQTCEAAGVTEPLRSHYQAGEVTALCEAAIDKAQKALTAIASLPEGADTLDKTLMAFETTLADFNDAVMPLTFTGYTATDPEVSEEGSACELKIGEFSVDIYTRRDLYQILSRQVAKNPTISPEQNRLLQQTLLIFEQNGLKLADSELTQVKDLKTQLSNKESQFSTNLNAEVSSITLSVEQLTGAPNDFLSRLDKTSDGQFIVTTKSTDYSDLMQNVSVPESRRKMMTAYLNRGGDANTKLMEEAVILRSRLAKILGFANWADARTSTRMAKSSSEVLSFLNNLKEKLRLRNQSDLKQLLDYKKQLDPNATTLEPWDNAFLAYQLQKRDFSLDNEKIREYFPSKTVVAGIFEIYSTLLGVKFVEVANAAVWADDVKLYEIHNADDCQLIGYFYTDFIPRAGKYGHAAAFPLISARLVESGKYSLPIASIVANFTPPVGDKPSLLTHDEVETFFHEFGHIMHQTLTRAPFASLSGTSVAQDFVEAPSQMLENWVWNADILNRVSGHYLNPTEKLPPELLGQLLAAKTFQQGSRYTKQLLYALFDMTLHTQENITTVNVTAIYDQLTKEIIGQDPLPGNRFPAGFGHLMGGYDAGYYGYLWSEVYAQDMFSIFPQTDLTNNQVGARYRDTILAQGNMKDAIELLKDFLGREPSSEAFFKMLGL